MHGTSVQKQGHRPALLSSRGLRVGIRVTMPQSSVGCGQAVAWNLMMIQTIIRVFQ